MSARGTDHNGWLICDGRSLNRNTYAALFAIIGTNFGSASGSSFNLPDCRGRVLGGIGQGAGLSNRTIGQSVGEETHTLTTSEMPSHNHGITDPQHAHNVSNTIVVNSQNTMTTSDNTDPGALDEINLQATQVTTSSSSATGITINNAGGGNAHNIMQPTLFVGNVFIFSGLV